MKSPKFYRKQIASLGIEDMEIDVSSLDNAMETLHELRDIENVLKKIRYNLRTNMRQIRLDYMRKIQHFEEESNKPGLFGRKKSLDKTIRQKKALIKERKMETAAYEIIESMIEAYLQQIEDAKLYIQDTIQKRISAPEE
jgi:hypothetical protein